MLRIICDTKKRRPASFFRFYYVFNSYSSPWNVRHRHFLYKPASLPRPLTLTMRMPVVDVRKVRMAVL